MKIQYSIAVLIIALSPFAKATLGQRVDTSNASQQKAAVSKQATSGASNASYVVQESTSGGAAIKEYVSNDGVVFAVTWKGQEHPDLAALFGDYYSEFNSASEDQFQKTKGHGRRPYVKTTSSNVTVEVGGHMGNMHGRAYVPKLVPTGVNVETLP